MSIECGYCEMDVRRGHTEDCPRYDPAYEACRCDPEWQPDCPLHVPHSGRNVPPTQEKGNSTGS